MTCQDRWRLFSRSSSPASWYRDSDRNDKILKTLIKSNDLVLIGFVRSLLDDAGIGHVLLDTNMSVLEGSIGILPQRIMVGEDDLADAYGLLRDAGLSHEHS